MDRDDEIFADAIELPTAARAALLDQACASDPAQRARIEALLAGHNAAGAFLEKPAGAPLPLPDEEKPGDVIGRYLLLQKIGEGGCGAVYLAEQKMPVHRRVALKVIKLGMDTRTVIARFEAERQALALMDHPDIARVFDAGATGAGRPFFVMELVDGLPITKFCDEHRLTIPARLELFARVCLALQHAHQKGIIHRDVKPSNILVALRDGEPAPKVIDFGIAKATQDRLTEQTLVTGVDQFIGTPAYMSPEQADRRDGDIDTRSDIYALGIVLYELLCGRLPFDPKTLSRAGVDELRRIIREVESPRPSAVVGVALPTLSDHGLRGSTRMDDVKEAGNPWISVRSVVDRSSVWLRFHRRGKRTPTATPPNISVAAARGVTPKQLSSALRGDLDWIVMRCLEKDRDRRYGSARELADDVLRHLRQEPVEARPPNAGYRLERFVARNRLACASAAAIALALIVGTVVSVRQAVRATRAERIANAERDLAQAASRAEAVARTDAQRRQEQAEDLLTFMLGDFRTELQKIGRLALLDSVGEKAMAYFAALKPEELTDTALARQAKALTQIGQIRLDQNRYADAHAAFTAGYTRAAALASRHPRDGDMLFERAQAEYWIGFVARRRGDAVAEREWLTRYRDSAFALLHTEGETPRAQSELAWGYHNIAVLDVDAENFVTARAGFAAEGRMVKELLIAAPGDVQLQMRLAEIASWLGEISRRDGDFVAAMDCYAEAASLFERIASLEPAVPHWRYRVAKSLIFAGEVKRSLGLRIAADNSYARAIGLMNELVAFDPANKWWRTEALHARIVGGRPGSEEYGAALSEALTELEMMVKSEPSSRALKRLLAETLRMQSADRLAAGRVDQAEGDIERAIEVGEALVREGQADANVCAEAAQAHLLAGRIAMEQRRVARAQEHWREVLALLRTRLATTKDCRLLDPGAQAYVLLGMLDRANPLVERLRQCGYHSSDPLAAPILDVASWSTNETQNQ
ncbi:serine/threonine-protein kinase [Opitutus terrae]|uniref:Serine/threonine protein kinase with TPR repeats n=1 Tax=Opitutus terrae (strain DSM 11246 / JCM 15787 / PB90-1) TaxID=452637 RepID=B1ZSA7_OPITP|nr:serine/threonine-protein kinase [Opitutus terrae]ACB75706.1 serine/threonine protein kinase with TPR repeats [Opitutus terrae PB90-1]